MMFGIRLKDIWFYGVLVILFPVVIIVFAYCMIGLKCEIRRYRKIAEAMRNRGG